MMCRFTITHPERTVPMTRTAAWLACLLLTTAPALAAEVVAGRDRIGQRFARQGYMRETILAVVHHAFTVMDLSRIEAACLPENAASRGVLEKTGFKYEGVAQSYLQINGRWRNHVLYANLRFDRRGRTDVG